MTSQLSKWLLVPVAALALTSCAGGGAAEPDDQAAAEHSFVEVTDPQGSVEGFVGALDDAEIELCEASNGSWIAEGAVTNPSEETQDYRIYVSFNKNRDTQGLVQVDVASVAAGATATWKAEAPISGSDLRCILRVERFAPQG